MCMFKQFTLNYKSKDTWLLYAELEALEVPKPVINYLVPNLIHKILKNGTNIWSFLWYLIFLIKRDYAFSSLIL